MRPQFGPDRADDANPLMDAAEVREARRILSAEFPRRRMGPNERMYFPTAPGADPDWLSEVEALDSADELGAARDLELWGCNPFEED